jgi:hypothetical protein
MNRKPLVLTVEQIDGDKVAYAASKVLFAHIEGLKGDERTEYIRNLPQHWRAIFTVIILEGEVNNGGHHQFFWNSNGALNKETLEDLKLISAHPFILLFEEAVDQYQRHDYHEEKTQSGNSWEAFTEAYKEERMAVLDGAFYKAPKTIAMHLFDYIRNNRHIYINLTTVPQR